VNTAPDAFRDRFNRRVREIVEWSGAALSNATPGQSRKVSESAARHDFLKRRYKQTGDTNALTALEAIGKPDPKNGKEYFSWSRRIRQFLNPSDTAWFADMRKVETISLRRRRSSRAISTKSQHRRSACSSSKGLAISHSRRTKRKSSVH
jgi:hypothetical protein